MCPKTSNRYPQAPCRRDQHVDEWDPNSFSIRLLVIFSWNDWIPLPPTHSKCGIRDYFQKTMPGILESQDTRAQDSKQMTYLQMWVVD